MTTSRHNLWIPLLMPQIRYGSTAFLLALSLMLIFSAAGSALGGPQANPHRPIQPDFQEGLVPVFVLGDLNEDGRVDQADRKLLAQILAAPGNRAPQAATCVAAGDLNLNSRIDREDLVRMDEWLKGEPQVEVPALTYDSRLPCAFRHLLIATRLDATPGEDVPIVFLEPGLSPENSTVAVESGPGTVRKSSDGKGYVVLTSSSASVGDHVVLLITLPKRKYYFAYGISPTAAPSSQ
jgi:hypothetical protein